MICNAHVVNLIEVYYQVLRSSGEQAAERAVTALMSDGLQIRRYSGGEFWRDVAQLKAKGGISLADCFCIALARRVGGEVVTSDHHEFDALVPRNLCPIRFVR